MRGEKKEKKTDREEKRYAPRQALTFIGLFYQQRCNQVKAL